MQQQLAPNSGPHFRAPHFSGAPLFGRPIFRCAIFGCAPLFVAPLFVAPHFSLRPISLRPTFVAPHFSLRPTFGRPHFSGPNPVAAPPPPVTASPTSVRTPNSPQGTTGAHRSQHIQFCSDTYILTPACLNKDNPRQGYGLRSARGNHRITSAALSLQPPHVWKT